MKRALLAFLLLAACGPLPSPTPGPSPASVATCETACARGAELGCPWSQPTPRGMACHDVCALASRIAPWGVSCLSTAQSCEAADACN
ncbi:MAG: hypothetical protein QG586_390 [Pseudomonadota bacterium]|nr:hypothetical protein [Pseudomonadota bacterium]MDQ1344860.1 hypothetical protein [Pseudomonadota bacterium]